MTRFSSASIVTVTHAFNQAFFGLCEGKVQQLDHNTGYPFMLTRSV